MSLTSQKSPSSHGLSELSKLAKYSCGRLYLKMGFLVVEVVVAVVVVVVVEVVVVVVVLVVLVVVVGVVVGTKVVSISVYS